MFDFLIVGAGLFGAICARELTKRGKTVLVIDQREHIGGNCADVLLYDVYVSLYGGHYFHTNNEVIWNYVTKLSEFSNYNLTAKVNYGKTIYSYPLNLMTFHQLWGIKTPEQARSKLEKVRVKIENPANFEEKMLSQVGEKIYEIFYYGYNKKHWGREPKELPVSLAKRITINYNYDERYFMDKYQGMPVKGYTEIFKQLLSGIEVQLRTPFEKGKFEYGRLIYTGSIDEYFDYRLGLLEYRGVWHKYSEEEIGTAMLSYPSLDVPFTRKFSYSYAYPENKTSMIVTATEYPVDGLQDRSYPVNIKANQDLYEAYQKLNTEGIIFGGRLGSYQYLNMDQVIAQALHTIDKL